MKRCILIFATVLLFASCATTEPKLNATNMIVAERAIKIIDAYLDLEMSGNVARSALSAEMENVSEDNMRCSCEILLSHDVSAASSYIGLVESGDMSLSTVLEWRNSIAKLAGLPER